MELVSRFFQNPKQSFFLFGPRGSGKSTWIKKAFPESLYIDLLSPDVFREFKARPERLTQLIEGEKKKIVIVDEVQKIPELLPVVHQTIENKKNISFVLTGSSARKLKNTGADLLAGRAVLRAMHPFMAAELGDLFSIEKGLRFGMLPIVWQANDPEDVLKTYSALYLKEEVQMEGIIRNIGNFARFLEAISFSHGSVINTSEVARECQVSRKTVESYINILEDLLLSFRLPVFNKKAKRLITQHPKFYYFDTGVFRSLRPRGPLDLPEEIDGAALEGLIAQHLYAFCAYDKRDYKMFFWRTKSGVEVDFILYGPDGMVAIELKRTSQVRTADQAGLKAFREDYPKTKTILLYGGKERLVVNNVNYIPYEIFLKELAPGYNFFD